MFANVVLNATVWVIEGDRVCLVYMCIVLSYSDTTHLRIFVYISLTREESFMGVKS